MRIRSRHVVLALVVATGAVAACLEIAARAEAARLVAALAPVATLTYASAGISFDGSARLSEPRLAWHGGDVTARVAYVRRPGVLWLVRGWFADDAERFASLDIDARGLAFDGAPADAMKGWWGTPVLAPFDSLGCGEHALNAVDRLRMGVDADERRDRFAYRYDSGDHRLDVTVDLDAPGTSSLRIRSEVAGFTPAALAPGPARGDVKLSRAEVAYRDDGYLARRNAYCAQRLSMTAAQFVDHHLAAVEGFLRERGIEPGADIRTAYRRLVEGGGTLAFASVPDPGWVPLRAESQSRSELLRLLSVTMRHDDTPPVMLRLAFTERPEAMPQESATAAEVRGGGESVATIVAATVPDPPRVAERSPEPVVAAPPVPAPTVAAADAVVPEPSATAMSAPSASPAGERASSAAPVPASGPPDAAAAASIPASPGRRIGEERLGASAPRPPEGSTLAMVWREGIVERLAPRTEQGPDHDVVGVGSLGQRVGQRVRLVTRGGKIIEGRVRDVDGARVMLAVRVGGGEAAMAVPLSNIREARVPRRAAAP